MNAEAHTGADGRNERAISFLPRRHSNIVYMTATNFEVCSIVQYQQGVGESMRSHNSALMYAKDVRCGSGHVHHHVAEDQLVRLPHARAAALRTAPCRALPPRTSTVCVKQPEAQKKVEVCGVPLTRTGLRSEDFLSFRFSDLQIF